MKQEFKDTNLSAYYFENGDVYNRNTKHKLTWVVGNGSYDTARVTMMGKTGLRSAFTRSKIQNFLVEVPKQNGELSSISLVNDYIMFSVVDQASQYFFAVTTIADALARFGRRGVVISPKDIRILDVITNKVSMIKVKVVETYILE